MRREHGTSRDARAGKRVARVPVLRTFVVAGVAVVSREERLHTSLPPMIAMSCPKCSPSQFFLYPPTGALLSATAHLLSTHSPDS